MSSRVEILNDGGYRSDGRRQYELRDISIDLSPRGTADGSALITHGLTEVMVDVFGPKEAKSRGQSVHDRATVSVEVGIMPFSTGERRKRNRGDKRVLELAASIRQTFEPIIQTSLYPRSEISIFVHILQQDGGLLPASINATTLALLTAGIPLTDYVTAMTCGVHSTTSLLDLTILEENDLPHLTVASLPRTGKVTLVTMETRLHAERVTECLKIAGEAGKILHKEMKKAVEARTQKLAQAMEMAPKVAVVGGGSGGVGDVEMEDEMDT
ncbi:Exosome non-catalytic core component [Steccherinum ochraceum]|uniref:Ribosomal RNA-processing protein 41 n=1 Tax=Steccherinum ochraceum TaxID=92696 RepID=A0A4R0RKQ0_9APHY|nr:Exosome non-catalytic core component [Steccherinum ochraceum]